MNLKCINKCIVSFSIFLFVSYFSSIEVTIHSKFASPHPLDRYVPISLRRIPPMPFHHIATNNSYDNGIGVLLDICVLFLRQICTAHKHPCIQYFSCTHNRWVLGPFSGRPTCMTNVLESVFHGLFSFTTLFFFCGAATCFFFFCPFASPRLELLPLFLLLTASLNVLRKLVMRLESSLLFLGPAVFSRRLYSSTLSLSLSSVLLVSPFSPSS